MAHFACNLHDLGYFQKLLMCSRLFGHWQSSWDLYFSKLRPLFTKHTEKIQNMAYGVSFLHELYSLNMTLTSKYWNSNFGPKKSGRGNKTLRKKSCFAFFNLPIRSRFRIQLIILWKKYDSEVQKPVKTFVVKLGHPFPKITFRVYKIPKIIQKYGMWGVVSAEIVLIEADFDVKILKFDHWPRKNGRGNENS